MLGRAFLPEEQETGKEHEVVLSYSLWQSHFAGNPEIIGRSVALSGETYTVVGVMPRDFKFAPFWATKAELWAPLGSGFAARRPRWKFAPRICPAETWCHAGAGAGRDGGNYRPPGARVSRHQSGHAGCFAARESGGQHSSRAARASWSRGLRAADCLRQCQPHAAGARGCASGGDCAAHGSRGWTVG